MRRNPTILRSNGGYSIRFVRSSGVVLTWIQDLTQKKMKSSYVQRAVVLFPSKDEAEREAREVVIPYLLKEKDVPETDIVGW